MVLDSNDETSFLHKLLLTDIRVSGLCKGFANNSSANMKLSKTQLSKMGHLGRFIGRFLGSLIILCLPLMENVLTPLHSYRCSYSKENSWISHDYSDNLRQRNERYLKNS